ncbi:Phage antirepressor protein [Streptococcus pseudoporcinus]|uniref:Phage antirepressor protein n=1 Tax=Streptococcus pseudoporcinus TaxID=361101 RepID=A0A4V6L598_9STRE|nr:phage antirepressor KilAC domain-containing protein [Streptococcus pseudoporcinus]VTS13425.1 Phage antirepressor protein [Streptococcus pseudoporcinus]VTS19365.1 Phage antirepressor protein [Streptococcus pseudoporcinus]VTS32377.1 Phage antirepressor protein [Streptococcus pseudoporcinus]
MNELINITLNENNEPVVSARDLHKGLEISKRFSAWFDQNSKLFIENEEFTSVPKGTPVTGGNGNIQYLDDYALTLDMAKQLAMMSRTDKGKEVRKYFIQVEKDFNSPEKIMARALLMADKKITNLTIQNNHLQLELKEAQKQARYLDLIIESKNSIVITQIAADYGMSAQRFNKILHELGVQHKVNNQWILYRRHMAKGYTDSKTIVINEKPRMQTTWTQKGRLFLYELLKENDYLPLIEQDEIA